MLERAIRPSLLVTSVLWSTVRPPPLLLALELRRAPSADTRRAGLFDSTLACARASSNVCTLYLVFKEPRPRWLSPSGAPAATRFTGRWRPSGADFRAYVTRTHHVNPFFAFADGPFRTLRPASGGFQGAYLAARALDRGHRVKRVSPIYEHQSAMSTPARENLDPREESALGRATERLTRLRRASSAARAAPSATPPECRQSYPPSSAGDDRR